MTSKHCNLHQGLPSAKLIRRSHKLLEKIDTLSQEKAEKESHFQYHLLTVQTDKRFKICLVHSTWAFQQEN